jgi:uncharacterized protein YjaG (DUF416 family)
MIEPIYPQVFLNDLEQQLAIMAPDQQLAFGAICSERHFPDYLTFSAMVKWGDPEPLRRAINEAWASSVGEAPLDLGTLDKLLTKCEQAAPDTEDFTIPEVSYALDAAVMACYLVEFLRRPDPHFILQLTSQALDLVDAKVQNADDLRPTKDGLEVAIMNHPWMHEEIANLRSTLDLVRRTGRSDLAKLRNTA